MPPATDDTIAALDALRAEIEACTSCCLHETRTRSVPGEGDPGADLMFVGEAPGYHEDQQGRPFVGQAGKLLEQLLAGIGLTREQVFIANVLKSRPPNNRDPRPEEIAACQPYLWRQIELIKPKVICTLGNFATKLLTGDQTGITRVHGHPRATEISGHRLYLYPIFHPAAALYTPAMLTTLKEDFQRLPALLAHAAPGSGEEAAAPPAAERPAWRPPERLRRAPEPAGAEPLLDEPSGDVESGDRDPGGRQSRDDEPLDADEPRTSDELLEADELHVADEPRDHESHAAGEPCDDASPGVSRPTGPSAPVTGACSDLRSVPAGAPAAAGPSSPLPRAPEATPASPPAAPPAAEPEQLGLF